jgi:hypothetical protein
MIRMDFFRNAQLTVNLVNAFIIFIGLSGTIILLPFYLQNILGHRAIVVGLMLCVVPIMLGLTSPMAGTLSDRFGSDIILPRRLVVRPRDHVRRRRAASHSWRYKPDVNCSPSPLSHPTCCEAHRPDTPLRRHPRPS